MTRLMKTMAVAGLATVMLSTNANADRRTGMGGNILIEDRDDMFLFPQLVLKYKNMIGFDFGDSKGEGNGVLTWGKGKSAFGVIVNRPDASMPIGAGRYGLDYELGQKTGMANPLASAHYGAYTAPATVVDFLYGTKLGNKNLGFRVGLGHGYDEVSPDGGDSTNDSSTVLRVGGGLTLPGTSSRGDIAFDLALAFGGDVDGGDDAGSAMAFGLGIDARFFKKMTGKMDFGYFGSLGFNTLQSVNLPSNDDNVGTHTAFNLLGGAGPVFHWDNSTVAGYGLVGFQMTQEDPDSENDDDGDGTTTVTIPGVRLAFEHELFEWLFVRSGMQYTWAMEGQSDTAGNAAAQRGGDFGWNAGLGFKVGNFSFDGALSHAWLNSGPDFVGGDGNLFMQSSATLTW
jgi:hypothetical protein